jgi:hypothetical protein
MSRAKRGAPRLSQAFNALTEGWLGAKNALCDPGELALIRDCQKMLMLDQVHVKRSIGIFDLDSEVDELFWPAHRRAVQNSMGLAEPNTLLIGDAIDLSSYGMEPLSDTMHRAVCPNCVAVRLVSARDPSPSEQNKRRGRHTVGYLRCGRLLSERVAYGITKHQPARK